MHAAFPGAREASTSAMRGAGPSLQTYVDTISVSFFVSVMSAWLTASAAILAQEAQVYARSDWASGQVGWLLYAGASFFTPQEFPAHLVDENLTSLTSVPTCTIVMK